MKGIVNGHAWWVDVNDEVQWRLRYMNNGVVRDDAEVAADVMRCYADLTDPNIPLEQATKMLKDARVVVVDILNNVAEQMAEAAAKCWVVECQNGNHRVLLGPYSLAEARSMAELRNGQIHRTEMS